MQRRILGVAVLASCAIGGSLPAAQASVSTSKATQGGVFGGVTATAGADLQGYPVVIELNKAATKVRRANIVVDLACSLPPNMTGFGDEYEDLAINRGTFKSSFGPEHAPGNPALGIGSLDISGSLRGRVNRARTKITGTWSLKIVAYDPTGAPVDTCDSGPVPYTAKN